jgi:hypothetical protein
VASLAVMTAVESLIAASWPHTPIKALNYVGTVPDDGSAFLTVTYPVATETLISVGAPGANIYREEGAFRVALAIPIGHGVNAAAAPWAQRIDTLRAALRGKLFGGGAGVTWEASPPIVNDENDSGAYFELSFAVPYRFDVAG